jgi:CheY-like chemotaxis protein
MPRLLYALEGRPDIVSVELLLAGRKDLVLLRALDLEQGLDLARSAPPDAILIDIALPGLSALDFMQRLRAAPGTETTPIIAVGANTSPAALARAIDAGFFLCLAKPLQAAPFLEALDYALEFNAVEQAERPMPRRVKEAP